MSTPAIHNNNAMKIHGKPAVFPNYLIKSIVEYESCDNMYAGSYSSPLIYSNLRHHWYPQDTYYPSPGAFPPFSTTNGKLHLGLCNQTLSNNTPCYWYDKVQILNLLGGTNDYSICFWVRSNIVYYYVSDMPTINPLRDSYFQENNIRFLSGAFIIDGISKDIDPNTGQPQKYYVIASYDPSQQRYPVLTDHPLWPKKTDFNFTMDGYTSTLEINNQNFYSNDFYFTSGVWNMLTLRRTKKSYELIWNMDFNNSLKRTAAQDSYGVPNGMLGVLTDTNHSIDSYHYEGQGGSMDEIYFFQKWVTNTDIRRLYTFRNLWW
jgi:hypothetical protein